MINTFLNYHLGDNLAHLHWMRKVVEREPSLQFTHACSEPYLVQLREVVSDLPQIKLVGLSDKPDGAIDVWKNRRGDFYASPLRDDWVAYHIEFFDALSRELGLESPLKEPSYFLFDYPALRSDDVPSVDMLIVNSQPLSGQFPSYNENAFVELIQLCAEKNLSVMTTKQTKIAASTHPRTLTGIGQIKARVVFGIANGPMWPTWNVYHAPEFRVVLSERERVDISPNTEHATSIERGIGALYERGIL
jgi:hypothetical protein